MMKNRSTILFDLDSTLLEVNQDLFLKNYFNLVNEFAKKLDFDSTNFINIFLKSAYDIVKNDGSKTNENRFWTTFGQYYDNNTINYLKKEFDSFYNNDFKSLEKLINKTMYPSLIIKKLKEKGYNIILATNPLYPRVATLERIKWTGIDYNEFSYISTYENSYYCKPKYEYYIELLKKNNLTEEECYMIGNDIEDDFKYLPKGIKKILILDYLINKDNEKIEIDSYTLKDFYLNIDNIF